MKKILFLLFVIISLSFTLDNSYSVQSQVVTEKKIPLEIYLVADPSTSTLTWTFNFPPERAWLEIQKANSIKSSFKSMIMGELEFFNGQYKVDITGHNKFYRILTVYDGVVYSNVVQL